MNDELFGKALEQLGEKIVSTINEKAAQENDVNFSFFARDGLLGLLCPSLALYYLSRAGQILARQQAIWKLMPYVFTTSKVKYMQTLVFMMHVESTAPAEIMQQLYAEGGTITNITGQNDFGNVEDDEANEMTGVRNTKMGAAQGTFESLSTSFKSSHVLSKRSAA